MKLKSLFEVIFKIMGVYLIVRAIIFTPQLISFIGYTNGNKSNILPLLGNIIMVLLMVFLFAMLGLYLIRRAEKVTLWIVPENRLEEDFATFKIHRSVVLTLAVIIIGGTTLVHQIPTLAVQVVGMINYNRFDNPLSDFNKTSLITSIVKILIALYMVFYCNTIVAWIELKRK
jgi:hypothetical protein